MPDNKIMRKYKCLYRDGAKKRQRTFKATSRTMAILGVMMILGLDPKDIISIDTVKR